MMELMKRICPDSPYVWNQEGVSECFDNLVLGLGVNIVTVVIVAVLGITTRHQKERRRIPLSAKILFYLLPTIGLCFAFLDMAVLIRRRLNAYPIAYHEWLFSFSQFSFWAIVILVATSETRLVVLCNRVLCFWWIAKLFLLIPRLQIVFSSPGVLRWLKESCVAITDMLFGILINIIRIKWAAHGSSSMEESLLPCKMEVKEDCLTDLGIVGNVWRLMTFKSIDPVMQRGMKKQLDFEDLLQLPSDMDPLFCHNILLSCWNAQRTNTVTHPSLFKAIYSAYGWPYFCLGLLKVLNDCLGFAGPILLNKLIHFLQKGSREANGYFLAISLGLISVLKSFLDTQYTLHLSKLRLKLRSSISTVIYRKCLCVSLAERSPFSEGEIQTFMSIDADRIVNLCNSVHDMWSLPLQIGIALFLLYQQVKFAFLSGVAIIILLIPVNKWIANRIANATKNMMEQKDERIGKTAELLTYIRTLKMYGWELLFAKWLMKTRSSEVAYLSTRKYLDAWCVFFWATTPTLFSLFTFGLYTMLGHQLDAATVFTCLALFNNLISPLNSFPWVINGLIDAAISTRRLSKYLFCYEIETGPSLSFLSLSDEKLDYGDTTVVLRDASCTWSSSNEEEFDLVLKHINLCVPKGFLVAVIGEVGSGKSSLLNLILREMRLVNGSIYSSGTTAYVPQVPWLLSGTIRENILFGKDYDHKRYSEILQACALDLDISLMIGGDMAYIGEKGVNLSGGQRARLALARAIYQGSNIYLLDDVLSAVDAHVACSILQNAILGTLLNQKTRILCTHNIQQAISLADMVVVMDKGHMKCVGSPSDPSVASYISFLSVNDFNTFSEEGKKEKISNVIEETLEKDLDVDCISSSSQAQDIIEVETRKDGRVEPTVYKNYAAFSGWFITILTCLSAILMQATRNGNDLWLSFWVDTTGSNQNKYSTTFYLIILCVFCLVNSCLTLVRAFAFAFGGLRAAVRVHDKLIQILINAPVSFFDQTPSGRILNRLSSDLYTIDDSLPFILNILLANFVGLLGIAVVLSYVQVVFMLLLLPFWYIYRKLQFYYRSTSRELRRLDSVSRSPLYASFTETLNGSPTIRAFKSLDHFFFRFTQHMLLYQRTSYTEIFASLWLSLRLQLLAACIVSFVAVMAIVGSHGLLPVSLGTPGLVGLALSYASPIVSLLGSFLTSFTETEKEMVSVERVLQYMDIPQEELMGENSLDPTWPLHGEIQFQNVTLRYMPSLPPALRDVSFTVAGGTQVGIVGRTGAGKSSILNAVFRLNPICGGRIIVDGINIAGVPVRDLRSRIAVVPQSPFLFEGSLRANLDPFQVTSDDKIWNTLEKCCVREEVEAAGGLDIHVQESGTSFSVGQRQLLCLARALLKSSKVLFLDECTANVDSQTASKLQKVIVTECRSTTVITIAHRISTVLIMDNILILDQGILVEQGNPHILLQNESSRFFSFARASTM
ncbi:ABC transporter C family member 13 isoform X4 [Olea europaea var. sylvestris]|uniref:ABC transporter C family member 13 isoform X4 n=1 Tax=Olea europaea var. sylvestris TaxID=158386 RepID=UPI000C1CFB01|nr:ABC transporter C family member 13 isoform X4 [Olea europaea var. sylvestris]